MLCNVEEDGKEKCAKYWDVKGLKYLILEKELKLLLLMKVYF